MKISDYFKPLDQRNFDMWQLKSLFTTGMEVFTDGYDLSSIGIVLVFVLSTFGIEKIARLYSLAKLNNGFSFNRFCNRCYNFWYAS